MADLIKHHGKYISRIRKWNGIKQVVIAIIPLKTDKKSTALVRMSDVKKTETDIKKGIINKHQFKNYFPWLNKIGESQLKLLSIKDVINLFIIDYATGVSESSVKRMRVSMNCFMATCNRDSPIENINYEYISIFKKHFSNLHKPHGINLNLRNIKTFLKWTYEHQHIEAMPKIKMLREPKALPKYISESKLNQIMQLTTIDDFYKKAFLVYYTTGCRRNEVILGELRGSILIVPAHLSKSREERQISLEKWQIEIVHDIHLARDKHLKKHQLITFSGKFTKMFKSACKQIEMTKEELSLVNLHCLRHTFAVRQWILTNDIYEVKNLLGHASVVTTEKYAKFNKDRLRQDFPSDWEIRLEVEKIRKNGISTPNFSIPISLI